MRWVLDRTGRLRKRPHYDPAEIDQACEALLIGFLRARYGAISFPISTNDLTVLLEQEVDDLDLYADFSEGARLVQGRTTFFRDGKPRVQIARELAEDVRRENRLRTTLTHELGHVRFHAFLWSGQAMNLSFLHDLDTPLSPQCTPNTLLHANQSDWMEWQAGYASGAFLMPITPLHQMVRALLEEERLFGPISLQQAASHELIERVRLTFGVSEEAARVRLLKLGYLTEGPSVQAALPLFVGTDS